MVDGKSNLIIWLDEQTRDWQLWNTTPGFSTDQPCFKYMSYICPLLEYGDYVWTNINNGEEDALESVQLAALRAITGNKLGTMHYYLYRELDVQPLRERRLTSRLTKLYEILHRDVMGRLGCSNFPYVHQLNPYPTRRGTTWDFNQQEQSNAVTHSASI